MSRTGRVIPRGMLGFVVFVAAGCGGNLLAPSEVPSGVAGRKRNPTAPPTLTAPPPTAAPTAEPTTAPTTAPTAEPTVRTPTPQPPPPASFSARLPANPDASALARTAGLLSFGLGIGLWLAAPPARKRYK